MFYKCKISLQRYYNYIKLFKSILNDFHPSKNTQKPINKYIFTYVNFYFTFLLY